VGRANFFVISPLRNNRSFEKHKNMLLPAQAQQAATTKCGAKRAKIFRIQIPAKLATHPVS
jgi:hypothetical protein